MESFPDLSDEHIESESKKLRELRDRTTYHERHLSDLFKSISEYALYSSEVRNRIDGLGIALKKYGTEEGFKTSSKLAFSFISNNLITLGDAKSIQIERIEAKVLGNLGHYGKNCKLMKDVISNSIKEKKGQLAKNRVLRKYKKKLEDAGRRRKKLPKLMAKAEKEYAKALHNSEKLEFETNEDMYNFEKKRLKEVIEVLRNFFLTELSFHSKALEIYTESYLHLKSINSRDDLEIISSGLGILRKCGNQRRNLSFSSSLLRNSLNPVPVPEFNEYKYYYDHPEATELLEVHKGTRYIKKQSHRNLKMISLKAPPSQRLFSSSYELNPEEDDEYYEGEDADEEEEDDEEVVEEAVTSKVYKRAVKPGCRGDSVHYNSVLHDRPATAPPKRAPQKEQLIPNKESSHPFIVVDSKANFRPKSSPAPQQEEALNTSTMNRAVNLKRRNRH